MLAWQAIRRTDDTAPSLGTPKPAEPVGATGGKEGGGSVLGTCDLQGRERTASSGGHSRKPMVLNHHPRKSKDSFHHPKDGRQPRYSQVALGPLSVPSLQVSLAGRGESGSSGQLASGCAACLTSR